MKNFMTFIGVVFLILFIITYFMYPAEIKVHIILGISILIAVFGFFRMKSIGKV
ncbi:MAG: hypothetical protein ABI359_09810 [Ginsengibacter sp.]